MVVDALVFVVVVVVAVVVVVVVPDTFLHPQARDSSINGCASEHSIIYGQNEYTDKNKDTDYLTWPKEKSRGCITIY